MHELPVTESLLRIAVEHAEQAGADRITDLHLVLGELSSIVDDSVSFYWDVISEGTIAQGAQLHFRRVSARMECLDCRHQYRPTEEQLACPACSSSQIRILSGEEFYLDSIEVQTEELPEGEQEVPAP